MLFSVDTRTRPVYRASRGVRGRDRFNGVPVISFRDQRGRANMPAPWSYDEAVSFRQRKVLCRLEYGSPKTGASRLSWPNGVSEPTRADVFETAPDLAAKRLPVEPEGPCPDRRAGWRDGRPHGVRALGAVLLLRMA